MYNSIAYVVYFALCISGLTWQVYELSSSYFLFDVSTTIRLLYSSHLPDGALNICFPYYRIFQFDQFSLDTNQNVAYTDTDSRSQWESNHKLFHNLTVDEILKYSPNIDETIDYCSLRNVTPSCIMSYPVGNECLKHYQVSKYVNNYFVCYRFILNISLEGFDDAMIGFDTIDPSVVSLISLNLSQFHKVTEFLAFFNSKDSLPAEELMQATTLDRILQADDQVMYNSFGVRYKIDRIQNLEPPYTTMCRKAVARDHYLKCVNESVVSAFNRMSSMSQHTNGSLKLMSDPFLQNSTNAEKYLDIVQTCRNMFEWNDCYKSVYTSSNGDKIRWEKFQVYSILPDQPDIYINSIPRLLFLDYATLSITCFGTWLGISVLGLNPFRWKKVQRVVSIAQEHVVSGRIRPMHQTIRLLLETVKQQQEWMVEMDQEVAKLKRKNHGSNSHPLRKEELEGRR